MMKVKALKNLGGVVTAMIGQEVEVTEAQALDLINQGVAEPVNAQEYMTLKSMTNEELAKVREVSQMAQAEFDRAVSEEEQKASNQYAEQKEQDAKQMAKQMQSQATQYAKEMQQQFQEVKNAQEQAEKMQAEAQVKASNFQQQAQQSQSQAHAEVQAQMKQKNQ
jgi:hypothetical protein